MMKSAVLADAIWAPDTRAAQALRFVLICLGGSLLLALSAKIKVPMEPVPTTLQLLVIVFFALSLGWRLAAATVAMYLFQGAMGLPVFTGTPEKGIGLAYMVGPTGGYLLGYFAAVVAVGWLADKGWARSFLPAVAAGLVGVALIEGLGFLWLAVLLGVEKAVLYGVAPFILVDAVKAMLAAAMVLGLWRVFGRDKTGIA